MHAEYKHTDRRAEERMQRQEKGRGRRTDTATQTDQQTQRQTDAKKGQTAERTGTIRHTQPNRRTRQTHTNRRHKDRQTAKRNPTPKRQRNKEAKKNTALHRPTNTAKSLRCIAGNRRACSSCVWLQARHTRRLREAAPNPTYVHQAIQSCLDLHRKIMVRT